VKRWPLIVYALLFAVTAAFRFLALKSGFVNDHFVYISGGRQMLFGEWPTRDWIDPGPNHRVSRGVRIVGDEHAAGARSHPHRPGILRRALNPRDGAAGPGRTTVIGDRGR